MLRRIWACLTLVEAFYLPGMAPVSYCEQNDELNQCFSTIQIFVNRLTSTDSAIPFEYNSFDFCKDEADPSPTENLGQVLFGERIRPSPYKFEFNKNQTCQEVCTKTYKEDNDEMKFLKHGMMFSVSFEII